MSRVYYAQRHRPGYHHTRRIFGDQARLLATPASVRIAPGLGARCASPVLTALGKLWRGGGESAAGGAASPYANEANPLSPSQQLLTSEPGFNTRSGPRPRSLPRQLLRLTHVRVCV